MNIRQEIRPILQKAGLLIFIVIFAVALTLLSDRFLTVNNLMNVLRQATINGILAVGMTMVILTAGIDLSVGSTLALAVIVAADLMKKGWPVVIAVGAGLGVGAVLGLLNGLLGRIVAHFSDGRMKDYGDPEATRANKFWQAVEAVRSGTPAACGIAASMPQTLCVNGVHDSMPEITALPADVIRTTRWKDRDFLWAEGLQEVFEQCYAQGILPSEAGAFPWARTGKVIDLREYRYFPATY